MSDVTIDILPKQEIKLGFERGGGGTSDYRSLTNKPSIEGTVLIGDKTLPQIGVGTITEQDIDQLIYG